MNSRGFTRRDLCFFFGYTGLLEDVGSVWRLDNDARLRHDFSQYRAMLKELRRSEESFEDGSKIAYLLQVGKHADSVICKMFRYKRDRDN